MCRCTFTYTNTYRTGAKHVAGLQYACICFFFLRPALVKYRYSSSTILLNGQQTWKWSSKADYSHRKTANSIHFFPNFDSFHKSEVKSFFIVERKKYFDFLLCLLITPQKSLSSHILFTSSSSYRTILLKRCNLFPIRCDHSHNQHHSPLREFTWQRSQPHSQRKGQTPLT